MIGKGLLGALLVAAAAVALLLLVGADAEPGLELTVDNDTVAAEPGAEVAFKLQLHNTGNASDDFVAEVPTVLEPGWSVAHYQDAGRSLAWPAGGLTLAAGELEDLWVFVTVPETVAVGAHPLTVAVHNTADDAAAYREANLTVTVQWPDLTPSNITWEVETPRIPGFIVEGDEATVRVNVSNLGSAEVVDACVEFYYYDEDADTDQNEGLWLVSLGEVRRTVPAGGTVTVTAPAPWPLTMGEWLVGARVDHDAEGGTGEVSELNESNNDVTLDEEVVILPELIITDARVDAKWATQNPEIDDRVVFTITVRNHGNAYTDNARLYIFHDNPDASRAYLKETRGQHWLDVDIPALEEKIVRFRWDAELGYWSGFRAEINPKYDDVDEIEPPNASCDHFIDESNRYTNNEFPAGGGALAHQSSGEEVIFDIIPDFRITGVSRTPSGDAEAGGEVTFRVTIINDGTVDWNPPNGTLEVIFDDGVHDERRIEVTGPLAVGQTISVNIKWQVPDVEGNVTLHFRLDGDGAVNYERDDYELDIRYADSPSPPLALAVAALALVAAFRRRGG